MHSITHIIIRNIESTWPCKIICATVIHIAPPDVFCCAFPFSLDGNGISFPLRMFDSIANAHNHGSLGIRGNIQAAINTVPHTIVICRIRLIAITFNRIESAIYRSKFS